MHVFWTVWVNQSYRSKPTQVWAQNVNSTTQKRPRSSYLGIEPWVFSLWRGFPGLRSQAFLWFYSFLLIPLFRFLNPAGMLTGAFVVVAVFLGAVWAGENKAMIKNFKKENPTLFVFLIMLASYLLMSLFGGVMVFLFGIKLPLICKSQLGN